MSTLQEKITVMQAFADGKDVEYYYNRWYPAPAPAWNWEVFNYRIATKKEPRVFYANVYTDWIGHPQETLDKARASAKHGSTGIIKLVEDLSYVGE